MAYWVALRLANPSSAARGLPEVARLATSRGNASLHPDVMAAIAAITNVRKERLVNMGPIIQRGTMGFKRFPYPPYG
ncbi:hypothetical protein JCM17961_34640 [Endothiovibrio diazotrophicus]